MSDLSTEFVGLKLRNPLIAASSGLTNTLEDIIEFEKAGVGAIVLKSLFEEEIRIELEKDLAMMNKDSFLYPETMGFYDSFHEVDDMMTKYLGLIRESKKAVSVPIIASINCVTAEKWPYYATTLQDAGADALELNVFSLPSDLSHSPEKDEKLFFDIVDAIKDKIKIPVILKISYYSSNLASLIYKLSKTELSAITLFNRFYSPDIDIDTLKVSASNVYSTPGELTLSLRWIALMADRVQCQLAASTGVHDSSALIKQLLAGADAVQVASVFYKNGKSYAGQMLTELEEWMDKHGFNSISDFNGKLSYANVENPAAYERTQFMKHFAGKEMKS